MMIKHMMYLIIDEFSEGTVKLSEEQQKQAEEIFKQCSLR